MVNSKIPYGTKLDYDVYVIPDVHGRTFWREILDKKDDIVIFLGDYVDSYKDENISEEQEYQQLVDIINYARENPKVVLLLGNHDLHYIDSSMACSRFNNNMFEKFYKLYHDNYDLFKIYHKIHNTYFSHAGIHTDDFEIDNLDKCSITSSFTSMYQISVYRGGFYPKGSPVWADLREFATYPSKIKQIVGHTMLTKSITVNNVKGIDTQNVYKFNYTDLK